MGNARNVGLVLKETGLSDKERKIVKAASLAPEQRNSEINDESSDVMDQKKSPLPVRVQRTFRIYPELLESLSATSARRKQEGYEKWSQDAIINHALKLWLDQYGN